MDNNKLNVVAAILFHDNFIYLPKRSHSLKNNPNKFEFPGGKVECCETLQEALQRELKEELSINVDINNIKEFPNNTIETDNIFLTTFIIDKWTNQLKINPEINSEILIIKLNELEYVNDLLETDKLIIPAIINFLK